MALTIISPDHPNNASSSASQDHSFEDLKINTDGLKLKYFEKTEPCFVVATKNKPIELPNKSLEFGSSGLLQEYVFRKASWISIPSS